LSPDPSRPHLTTASSQVSLAITGLAGYGGSEASETRQTHAKKRAAHRNARKLRDLLMIFPYLKLHSRNRTNLAQHFLEPLARLALEVAWLQLVH